MVSSQDDGSDGVEISAGQKMFSAISGSLFTSLLGKLVIPILYLRCDEACMS